MVRAEFGTSSIQTDQSGQRGRGLLRKGLPPSQPLRARQRALRAATASPLCAGHKTLRPPPRAHQTPGGACPGLCPRRRRTREAMRRPGATAGPFVTVRYEFGAGVCRCAAAFGARARSFPARGALRRTRRPGLRSRSESARRGRGVLAVPGHTFRVLASFVFGLAQSRTPSRAAACARDTTPAIWTLPITA